MDVKTIQFVTINQSMEAQSSLRFQRLAPFAHIPVA
jgi:hypothetical protein